MDRYDTATPAVDPKPISSIQLPGGYNADSLETRQACTQAFFIKKYTFVTILSACSSAVCMEWLMVDRCAAQVFVPSKDGKVKIPMFIVAKKNVTLDGTSPTFLYAYGGKSPGAV